MLASLPMYDMPEVKEATNAFWQAMATALGHAGTPLARPADHTTVWNEPGLFFSQTCGYPFTHAFRGKLTYVATPHYEADGCNGALYRSIVFARENAPLESFRNKRAAFNNPDSMSGMLALKLVFAPLARQGRFFASAVESGSHVASLAAVQSGTADVCAVDCVTVALLRRHRPAAFEGLVEVARSPHIPGLPFVTRAGPVEQLRTALRQVVSQPQNRTFLDALLLSTASALDPSAYEIIPNLEARLRAEGDLKLA